MKTKIWVTILAGTLVFSVVSAALLAARPDNPGNDKQPTQAGRPEKLKQIIFVHPVAPDDQPGKGNKPKPPEPPKDNTYYQIWAQLAPESGAYYVNGNVNLITGGDPVAAVNAAVEAWDAVTATDLFTYAGTTSQSWYAEDGQNTISWVKFLPRDYIAVAVMWYDDTVDPWVIYEFDIVFNTFHSWGIDPVKEDKNTIRAFDIQNIATHEFGHPVGLDDLYDTLYRELTMYGYSSKGETQKCSLEEGDIAGAQSLYGPP